MAQLARLFGVASSFGVGKEGLDGLHHAALFRFDKADAEDAFVSEVQPGLPRRVATSAAGDSVLDVDFIVAITCFGVGVPDDLRGVRNESFEFQSQVNS